MIDILTFSKQTENEKVTYTKIGMAPAQGWHGNQWNIPH